MAKNQGLGWSGEGIYWAQRSDVKMKKIECPLLKRVGKSGFIESRELIRIGLMTIHDNRRERSQQRSAR